MNSIGGDWSHGMAIYDAIKLSNNYITIINMSAATSMTSIILQSADYRIMAPNGHCMIHDGSITVAGIPKSAMSEMQYEKDVLLPFMYNLYLNKILEKDKKGEYKVDAKKAIDLINRKMPDEYPKLPKKCSNISHKIKTHITNLFSRYLFYS